jgi:hypothetical protein
MMPADAWTVADPTLCEICGRESCEDHLPTESTKAIGLNTTHLADATVVAAEGQRIAAAGVPYLVTDLIPNYGMLGTLVAYTKVGKTSFALELGAAVAAGHAFLDRATRQARVLAIAAEDPPEYTAWLSRHLGRLPAGAMTFYRCPIQLNTIGLDQIATTVAAGGYGLVLIASWQAVVAGLVKDENDNAASVRIMEQVKHYARKTAIPWLIDAHSGKGEDQSDDADPGRAMRGASAAASAADYTLSLRYANGAFGTQRRLSGKGRFVSCASQLLDYDREAGTYAVLGSTTALGGEITWRQIYETGALTMVPQTADEIAHAAGLVRSGKRSTGTHRRHVRTALHNRDGIQATIVTRRGQKTTLYSRLDPA